MVLTLANKIEIIDLARNRTQQEAADSFNARHPDRAKPLHRITVGRLFHKLRTQGDLNRKKRTKPMRTIVREMNFKDQVHERFTQNPHLSTRKAALQLGTSQWKVWKVLKEMKFFAYKKSKHQKLHPDDPPRRKRFCEQLLHTVELDNDYLNNILWTDEKPFYMNGCFNRQNFR